MGGVGSISVLHGWLPAVSWIAALAGLVFLLLPRPRRRWYVAYPVLLVLAVAITWILYVLLVYVWLVISEPLPMEVLAWAAGAIWGILLALYSGFRSPWRWRSCAAAAGIAVVVLGGLQVNAYFGQYLTVGSLLGTPLAVPALPAALERGGGQGPGSAASGPDAVMPSHGTVAQASIPAPASGFEARNAIIYLPPAYDPRETDPRGTTTLPVLVLVAGQPGGPQRWLDAGELAPTLDSFAAAHQGQAPVVVVVDPNGSIAGNTMCMDSRIARADTYLSVDVPNWITRTLNVSAPGRGWAFGGFSFGGTCALQMGTMHPQIYPGVIDISGQREPALSVSRRDTIARSFGGDAAAFDSRVPLTLLQHRRYPATHAFFAVGARDRHYGAAQDVVVPAARAAGMDVQATRVAGAGHSWAAARAGLAAGLQFLAPTWGMGR